MKKINLNLLSIFIATLIMLSGCQVVGGIFKAGVWVGITIVVIIIVLVLWLGKKMF